MTVKKSDKSGLNGITEKSPGYKDSKAPPCYLIPTFAACHVVGNPCDLCHNFSSSSSFFISYSDPFLPNLCRCTRLLQHLITLNDTHTHTQTQNRPPLDERSAGRRDLYLTKRNVQNRRTPIPAAGFEPAIATSDRQQTHALNRAANEIGCVHRHGIKSGLLQ